jgi:hypothetical protein
MKAANSIRTSINSKFRLARKFTLPALLVLSTLSANALAMGRNNAPCTLGDDCAATIYYNICNGNRWCFWY